MTRGSIDLEGSIWSVKKRIGDERIERYWKFSVLRDPLGRAVSQFFFEKFGEGMLGLPEDFEFSDYLKVMPNSKLTDSWLYTIDGKLVVDR